MKILCLSVILANIFLLMWEYRNGAFAGQREQQASKGKEQILLLSELEKEGPTFLPSPNHETQFDGHKLTGGVGETPRHINKTNAVNKAYPPDRPEIQLP